MQKQGQTCEGSGPDPDKDKGGSCPREGNPISVGTGNKFQRELDFSQAGGRLYFERAYNSTGSDTGNRLSAAQEVYPPDWTMFSGEPKLGDEIAAGPAPIFRTLDRGWTHTYSRYVSLSTYSKGALASVLRPGGNWVAYTLTAGQITADADVSERLTPIVDGAGKISGWRYINADNEAESFDAEGRVVRIQSADGYAQDVTYDQFSQLLSVTDSFGRSLRFAYDTNAQLVSITDAQAVSYRYGYDSNGDLSTATYPDAATRTYLYDEPSLSPVTGFSGLLTGIQDENTQRFATFAYDAQGRAIRTEHAGGAERVSLAYTRDSAGNLTALKATDAIGATRDYRYTNTLGRTHTTSVSQPGGSGCYAASSAISYDANGNVSQRTDFVGNTTHYNQYDLTRNLELHRIEGYGSANAVNISTQWHPFWRLKTRVAEPKRITTWVYNGQPDPSNGNKILRCAPTEAKVVGEPIAVICKRVEQATTDETGAQGFAATVSGKSRVWTYTYNAFGQVLRENGPRTDVADTTTYTYYTDTVFNTAGEGHTIGDLRNVTNAAGHVTKHTLYDRAGRLLRRLEANGAETRYAYTPRGWLTSEVLRYQGQERFTSYTYDKVGQLTQIIAPNDYVVDFSYDAAHRLTELRDSLGNHIQYILDAAGNRLQEDVKDASGVLVKHTKRVFDQLGRLQNVKVTQ